jgi:hypothetical protein
MTGSDDLLIANGVDAITGDYLLAPQSIHDVALAARRPEPDRPLAAALAARHRRAAEAVFAPRQGVDPGDLAQTGWGVVFAADADPSVRHRLRPLLECRRTQAAAVNEHRYREFVDADGYRAGESKLEFLRRHGSGPGPVDPDVIPYYLLLVGGPDGIPFDVQYQLDVQHAVGRLYFDDLEAYARYAENAVAAETLPRTYAPTRMAVFATRNDGDPATALSAEHLAAPVAAQLGADAVHWRVDVIVGAEATKDRMRALLSTAERPDVLFTATHGVGFPSGHPQQRAAQGGLVCQDWPGPGRGGVGAEHWFGGRDILGRADTDLTGMIAFLFACFGAGTPSHDDFDRTSDRPRAIAPEPFVAALPQALLGREGGALAVVGHVDRAWGYSFVWPGAGRQSEVYRSTLADLGAGQPVGSALEYVGDRYAELASDLGLALEEIRLGRRAQDDVLAGLWTARSDARGFALIGDPAVRLTRTGEPRSAVGQAPGTALRTPSGTPATRPDRSTPSGPDEHPVAGGEPQMSPLQAPVEVATYVTDDPAGVACDEATGRITGARLYLHSYVDLDGTARHVVTGASPPVPADGDALGDRGALAVHARMLEVSLAARRQLLADAEHVRPAEEAT